MRRAEFGADGIRSVAGQWPLDDRGVVCIAQALGAFLRVRSSHPVVMLGRDTRPSGVSIAHWLEAGLLDAGVDVINLGVMTTPGVAYLTRRQQADLGICVSASHSPPQYNGVKLVDRYGLRLQREDEMEIEDLIAGATSATAGNLVSTSGQSTDGQHLRELYIQDHVRHSLAANLAGLRVVLDCADGAASHIAPEVFTRLGAEVHAINASPNGEQINLLGGSEHVRQHPEDLLREVRSVGATYGFAFDGDGDRLIVVDAEGFIYNGDDLLFALARHFHGQGKLRHDTVVTTQMANRGLDVALGALGVRVIRVGKGDKAVEAAMWSGGYLLGGEQVGNLIINDGHHTAADAIYTGLVLAGILHTQGFTLRELVLPFQKWPQVLAMIALPSEKWRDVGYSLEEQTAIQRQVCRARLGNDCRILAWPSSTEPGRLKVMIEGGPGVDLDAVKREAVSFSEHLRKAYDVSCAETDFDVLSERRLA